MSKSSQRATNAAATSFADALFKARKAVHLQHGDLARLLGVSVRTIVRWEGGDGAPREFLRGPLVSWLASVPRAQAEPVLRAMGVLSPDTPVGAMSAKDAELTKMLLEHALLLAAETHDLAPRALRAAVLAVLDAAQKVGVSVSTSRALLTGPSATK